MVEGFSVGITQYNRCTAFFKNMIKIGESGQKAHKADAEVCREQHSAT